MLFFKTGNYLVACLIFIYKIKAQLASTEYHEEGSDVCLHFSLNDLQHLDTVAIKKDNLGICGSFNKRFTYTFAGNWGNRTFNCTVSAERMSVCFGDFRQTDAGLFSLHSSFVTDSPCLKNITVKQATLVTSVTLVMVTTPITLTAGQQMNLSCITSSCIPPANITWYMSTVDLTNQSKSTIYDSNGLFRTFSSMQRMAVKEENGENVYCKASNIQGKSVTSLLQRLNVRYKPELRVIIQSPYRVIEHRTAILNCAVTDANPNTNITWQWSKTDSPNIVLYNAPSYTIPNIQREMSGTYSCTASNSVGTSEAATIVVDVQYRPEVRSITRNSEVIERQAVTLRCAMTDANPSTNITWRWIKIDSPDTELHNGPNYTIPNIQRERSGSYNCTARNSVGTSDAATITVDVQYKPEIRSITPSPYRLIEGQTATLTCQMTVANPNSNITWAWIKSDSPSAVLFNGLSYVISNIQRGKSGPYVCTASNSVGISDGAVVVVDVQYKPSIENKERIIVNKTERVVLTRDISSNPLANVSWFDGVELLQTQASVNTTSFIIEKTSCTDTKNFTLVASNIVGRNVTSLVELIVNCKPMTQKNNISVGVTEATGIKFSTTIIAYPQPQYVLVYGDGATNNNITGTLTWNAVNNFTIHFTRTVVKPCDYGLYHLRINNAFGSTLIYINVFPQRKPDSPRNIEVACFVKRARVQWKSSYDGGDPQSFIVFAINGQQDKHFSDPIPDKGENENHVTFIENLQTSLPYVFYVSAQNSHGSSSSDIVSCATLKETSDQSEVVAGSMGGTLTVIAMIFAVVFVMHKLYTCSCTCDFSNVSITACIANKQDVFRVGHRSEIYMENVNTVKTFRQILNMDSTGDVLFKTKPENFEFKQEINYHCRNSTGEVSTHYTNITGQENTDRNVYNDLAGNDSEKQYEAITMTEREREKSYFYKKTYESLLKPKAMGEQNLSEKTGDVKEVHVSSQSTGTSEEYTNTTFMS